MNASGVSELQFVGLLNRIYEVGSVSEDPGKTFKSILDEIVDYFDADSATISLFEPVTNRLFVEAFHGLPDDCKELSLPMGVGLTGWVALNHKPARVNDVSRDSRYLKITDPINSALAVPLLDHDFSLGVLAIESNQLDHYTEHDEEKLLRIAGVLVRVVSRIWRITNLKRKSGQLESIVSIVGRLTNRFESEGIWVELAAQARKLLDSPMCSLYLVKNKRQLELEVLVGREGIMGYSEVLSLEDSSIGTAVTHKKMVEVHNLPVTEEHHITDLIQEYQLDGMLSVPIIFESEVIGIINVYTDEPYRFSDTEKQIFLALAGIGGISMENSRLYNRIMDTEESLRDNERLTTLGLLSAEIAHEVRNPLTVIKLLVESLSLDTNLDENSHEDIQVIQEKIANLGEIVGRVLDFGKSQSQMFVRWDLNMIVEETIQLVRFKLKRAKVKVRWTREEPGGVNCNKGQIQQVLLNLFINSEEAMEDGGEVEISLKQEDSKVCVYFSDTGSGIPENIRDGIFDSFLSGKPKGSGLGLSIVKRILRDHRGDIEILETSEHGTTFKFWLPSV